MTQEYSVDSLPVPICAKIRICRCRLYQLKACGQAFRDYIASKRRYFYGLRVHLLMTPSGLSVEVMLAPGSEAYITAFHRLALDLSASATIFADKGYVDQHEEALLQNAALRLNALRRNNSRQPLRA